MVNFPRGDGRGEGELGGGRCTEHTLRNESETEKAKGKEEWCVEWNGREKNRLGIYLRGGWRWGRMGLRLIGNQGTLGGIEGFRFGGMGLLIKRMFRARPRVVRRLRFRNALSSLRGSFSACVVVKAFCNSFEWRGGLTGGVWVGKETK